MILKLKLVLLVVFFAKSPLVFGQEIIYSSKNLKGNANNIFPKTHSLRQSKSKVYNLGNNLIIDYVHKHYIYSLLFDENMSLIEEQNWKIEDSTYSFFESFGEISNRIYVFKGFLDTKLFLFSLRDKKEITINIKKNRYLGAFSTQSKFYLLGYNKKNKSIAVTTIDKNLKTHESFIAISNLGQEQSENTSKILNKVFSKSNFDEASQFQLNTTREIIHKNKFYPRGDYLYFSINPEHKNNTTLKSYLISINLETLKSSLLDIELPLLKGATDLNKLEVNSILQDDEYFIVYGDKNSFSFLAIDKTTGNNLCKKVFNKNSFLGVDYKHRFDFELSGLLIDKKNNQKSVSRNLKTIFTRNIGVKAKLIDEFYHLSIETIAGLSSNSITNPNVITTKNYPGMIDTGYNESAKISLNLIFNRNSSGLENIPFKNPFQKIDDFMKESFYYSFKLLGSSVVNQKKRIPSGELRFNFKNSHYLTYYNHQDEEYNIRKFN